MYNSLFFGKLITSPALPARLRIEAWSAMVVPTVEIQYLPLELVLPQLPGLTGMMAGKI